MFSVIQKQIFVFIGLLVLSYSLSNVALGAESHDPEASDDFFAKEDSAQNPYDFNDQPQTRMLKHPAWFKQSFLDLREDLKNAQEQGKLGLILYFGQENCAYCEKLLEINFNQRRDIVAYTQKFFDLVAINIWGDLPVTTPDGQVFSEKHFADAQKTHFTPSLIFYDTDGKEVFRMQGYYPPYRFRAGLDYVVGGYYRQETFRNYLERAEPPLVFEENELNYNEIFAPPPYLLVRRPAAAQRPLAVFFEQGNCHACDLLHSGPLRDPALLHELNNMEVVQLDMWADTPLVTPAGEKTTAKAWANALKLFYTPTLLFFDESGKEIIRIESTVQLYRLSRLVQYVLSKDYQRYPLFQRWHTEQVQTQH